MTATTDNIITPLRQATDPRQAGGKAATLAALAAEGFPVPDGVVVGSHVFADAIRAADGSDLTVAADVVAALVRAIRPWGDVPVVVRSSSVDEDLPAASYAGLYTSVLGVRGEHELTEAVHRCWASAFADRVSVYAPGGERTQPRMALLVQPLVPADAAGVAFSADPVTGERSVVIDAVLGLADRLVSGEVTPERWKVRDDHAIREHHGPADVLNSNQAYAIADLTRRVEAACGTPQDIEWALVGDQVTLLQARPITALPKPAVPLVPIAIEVPEGFWTRERSHAAQPWTRLSQAVYEARISASKTAIGELGLLFEGLDLRDIGGLEYMRIVPLGGRQPPPLPAWLAPLAFRLVPALRRRIRECVAAIRADVPMRLIRRWIDEWRPGFAERIAAHRDADLRSLDDDQLDAHAQSVLALFDDGLVSHFRVHFGLAMILGELGFVCRDVLGWADQSWLRLVAGSSERSTEPARVLAVLAAYVAARPRLRALVDESAPLATIMAEDNDFADRFTVYLRQYGCRLLAYELAEPALDERPELVLALLRDQMDSSYDPSARKQKLTQHQATATAEARAALTLQGTAELHRFESALDRALTAYPLREDNEYFAVSAPGALVRRTVLEFGHRLAQRGQIPDQADAFHLRPGEMRSALRNGDDLRNLVTRRAGERAWAQANPGQPSYGAQPPGPPSLTSLPPEARFANEAFLWTVERILAPNRVAGALPAGDGKTIVGVAASPGSYTGTVRVIRDETEFDRLRAGEILVCPMTSPVWSILFPSVGAIVADSGGVLSHTAIIAREYAIPAVVSTVDATVRLRDGQVVTVNGAAGLVHVVS